MMKRFMLALGAGLLAIAMATPTFAADLPRPAYKAPYKNPVYVAPFSWTGLYVGINGGYGWGKTNWTFAGIGSSGDFNTKGAFVGGTVGYNLQLSSYVIGAEGDFDASWIKGNNAVFCVAPGCETRNQWLSTGRVRLGYAWDRWLPFLTGGAAFGSIKMTPGPNPTDTKTALGWTAGGGIEYAFMNEWSVKAEYLYVDLGKVTCAAAACGVDTDVTFKSNLVRLGVNYRF
jgi:outer membrane immunogenic protein